MDTIDRLIRDVVGIKGERVGERRRVVVEGYVNQLLAAERGRWRQLEERADNIEAENRRLSALAEDFERRMKALLK